MPPPRRPRPDVEQIREALREHDERTEEKPEVPQPPGSDEPDVGEDETPE